MNIGDFNIKKYIILIIRNMLICENHTADLVIENQIDQILVQMCRDQIQNIRSLALKTIYSLISRMGVPEIKKLVFEGNIIEGILDAFKSEELENHKIFLDCISELLDRDINNQQYYSNYNCFSSSECEHCGKYYVNLQKYSEDSNKENLNTNISIEKNYKPQCYCRSLFIEKLNEFDIFDVLEDLSYSKNLEIANKAKDIVSFYFDNRNEAEEMMNFTPKSDDNSFYKYSN